MGCFFSCRSSEPFDCVRVIHINGYIEDFAAPVTVADVTGKPPKHMLCSSAQLLSIRAHPLRPDDRLEPGRIYFLLPHSVFQSDSSPVDLASLVTRLTAVAKRGGPAGPVMVGSLSDPAPEEKNGSGVEVPHGNWMWSQPRTWKPVLETIREWSFRRRESGVSFGSMTEGRA